MLTDIPPWDRAKNATTKGIVGYVLAFGIALAFEGAVLYFSSVLFGRDMVPRGLGWITGPFIAGIAGARWLQSADLREGAARLNKRTTKEVRFAVALYVGWAMVYLSYLTIRQPYVEGSEMALVLMLPPTVALGILGLARWAT